MLFIRSLMAQQISVCPCIKIALIALLWLFTDRECNCAVQILCLNPGHYLTDALIRVVRIFTSLQHKGTKTKLIAALAACHNLLRTQAVAVRMGIAVPYTAVETIVFAVVGKLYQPSYKNLIAIGLVCFLRCPLSHIINRLHIICLKQHMQLLEVIFRRAAISSIIFIIAVFSVMLSPVVWSALFIRVNCLHSYAIQPANPAGQSTDNILWCVNRHTDDIHVLFLVKGYPCAPQ